MDRHPAGERLLEYADGEASAREAGRIRAHLEACWQCRTELEDLQRTVGECVRYRRAAAECLPPPPQPWFDIHAQLEKIDARETQASRLAHLAASSRAPRRWAPLAAAAALAAIAFLYLRDTPSVRAAELLRKAVVAAETNPPPMRAIQLRTSRQKIVRPAGVQPRKQPDSDALQARFEAAHYSWNDPLSARAFSEWRDRLLSRMDEVGGTAEHHTVATRTSSNEIVVATLKLRKEDLRPVETRLEFKDHEWVEITELPLPAAEQLAVTPTPGEPAAPLPPAPAAAPAPMPVTAGQELQVFAALRRLDADLGDPIEVRRTQQEIVVTGVGVDAERQRHLRQELSGMPQVRVTFAEESTDVAATATPAGTPESVRASASPLQSRIENELGSRAAFEQYADTLLALGDGIMARAHALRRLDARFGPQIEAALDAEDRALLLRLRSEHAVPLTRAVREMETQIRKLTGPATADAAEATAGGSVSAEELLALARRVEARLATIFAGAAGEASIESLSSAVAALRAAADAYEQRTQ
jgi:hypothetical protein